MNFASVDRGWFGGEVDLLMLFSLELFVVVHCLCVAPACSSEPGPAFV